MRMLKTVFSLLITAALCSSVMADVKITKVTAKGKATVLKAGINRTAPYKVKTAPKELLGLQCVSVPRGNSQKKGTGYSFNISSPATVYLLVDNRMKGDVKGWKKTKLTAVWLVRKASYKDKVYMKDFAAGEVKVPANSAGVIPHMAVVKPKK